MNSVLNSPYTLPVLLGAGSLLDSYINQGPLTREQIVKPKDEHVLILGGSEGCGKGLAEEYVLKRGAKVFLVARTESKLKQVSDDLIERLCKQSGASREEAANRVSYMTGDISSSADLIKIRDEVIRLWGKLDTLHIISGVPSTQTIYQATGLEMLPTSSSSSSRTHRFVSASTLSSSPSSSPQQEKADEASLPGKDALKELEDEGIRLAAINMNGVILSVGCFLPLLSSTSKSPLIHHLSSVAALVPAPTRMLYSASKTAGLAAFKTCAVECERNGGTGSGVRFLGASFRAGRSSTTIAALGQVGMEADESKAATAAICPGTIDTGFREKSASAMKAGGKKNLAADEQSGKVGKVLSVQDTVDSIIYHASLPPKPTALVLRLPLPILGDLLKIRLPFIKVPPKNVVVLPEWPYRLGWWVDSTWLRGIIESMGRRKYGLV